MITRLYKLFVAPRQLDEDIRNREVVLNVLLAGTLLMLFLALPLSFFSWLGLHHHYALVGVIAVSVAIVAVGILYTFSRIGRYRLAAILLVSLYFLLASGVVYQWGITIPSGVLLNGLVIVLAGILIGPAYSLYMAGVAGALLLVLQNLADRGLIHPDWSWVATPPSTVDALGFCLIFGLIALVTWLFNKQMERSLHRMQRAESALTRQKELLESTVEERTRELQAAQLERIQQMYRFAQLGQLSTALLHDLANHLTTLTLDIEGLEAQSRSRMVQRAKRSIRYIDDMVLRVRDQLQGRSNRRQFSIAAELDEVVQILNHRAQGANVSLSWQALSDRKGLRCNGEPFKFRQLIANLISNGIDAYVDTSAEKREVLVTAESNEHDIVISVHDWGKGVSEERRDQLFEPFFSTKKTGMGMGLFIAKQIAEEHFHGSLVITGESAHTVFVLRVKRARI